MGELFEKSSPIPPQKLPNNNSKIESLVCKQTVGARQKTRFCYRKRVGTTKTPHAKRIDNNVLTFPSVCDIILHTLTRKR